MEENVDEGDNGGNSSSSEDSDIVDHPISPPYHEVFTGMSLSEDSDGNDDNDQELDEDVDDDQHLQPIPVQVINPQHEFQVPSRKVREFADVDWESCNGLFGFVSSLNVSIRGIPLVSVNGGALSLKRILKVLNRISEGIDDYIPGPLDNMIDRSMEWHGWVANQLNLMSIVLPDTPIGASQEVFYYFKLSFGSLRVCSYGIYNEIYFICWLYCLCRLGVVGPEEYEGIVAKFIVRYREVVKKMRETFKVIQTSLVDSIMAVPSDGFLSYVFGSAELVGQEDRYLPIAIMNPNSVSRFSYGSYIFKVVHDETRGGNKELSVWVRAFANANSWMAVNRHLLTLCRAMMRCLPVLKKIKSGSLIQLCQ